MGAFVCLWRGKRGTWAVGGHQCVLQRWQAGRGVVRRPCRQPQGIASRCAGAGLPNRERRWAPVVAVCAQVGPQSDVEAPPPVALLCEPHHLRRRRRGGHRAAPCRRRPAACAAPGAQARGADTDRVRTCPACGLRMAPHLSHALQGRRRTICRMPPPSCSLQRHEGAPRRTPIPAAPPPPLCTSRCLRTLWRTPRLYTGWSRCPMRPRWMSRVLRGRWGAPRKGDAWYLRRGGCGEQGGGAAERPH